eukprot:s320_g34.t1
MRVVVRAFRIERFGRWPLTYRQWEPLPERLEKFRGFSPGSDKAIMSRVHALTHPSKTKRRPARLDPDPEYPERPDRFVPPIGDPFRPDFLRDPRPDFWIPNGLLGPRHPAWGQVLPGRSGGMMPRFDPIGPGAGVPDPDHMPVPGRGGGLPTFHDVPGQPGRGLNPDGIFFM